MSAAMQTPRPQQGTWTLTAPDGRTWTADTPLRCVSVEMRERVPAEIALARILDAAYEPTELEKEMLAALQAFVGARMQFPAGSGAWSIGALYEAEKLAAAAIANATGSTA